MISVTSVYVQVSMTCWHIDPQIKGPNFADNKSDDNLQTFLIHFIEKKCSILWQAQLNGCPHFFVFSFLFLFFFKLIVAYRLCVIYVREDNDFNV